MSTRRIHQAPTYLEINDPKEIHRVVLEIKKFRPTVEVSVEHHPELAIGKMVDWNEQKKLFTVEWSAIPEAFKQNSGTQTGLRAFFKVSLFTTQLVFKCELIRRLQDGAFQYRNPTLFYKNQKRGALRVPLSPGAAALKTPIGDFPLMDLSATGARIKMPVSVSKKHHEIEGCSLKIGKNIITTPEFGIKVTNRFDEQVGIRFHGLNEGIHVAIKQFLIEALHDYFKENHSK